MFFSMTFYLANRWVLWEVPGSQHVFHGISLSTGFSSQTAWSSPAKKKRRGAVATGRVGSFSI